MIKYHTITIFIFTILVICGFIAKNLDSLGALRPVEKYHSYAYKHPENFAKDDFITSWLSTTTNNLIVRLINSSSHTQRVVTCITILLASIAVIISMSLHLGSSRSAACITAILFLGSNPNPIAFNYEMPVLHFQGSAFAAFFVLVGLFYFIQNRMIVSAIFSSVAFYFHPGMLIWLFCVYGIYFLSLGINVIWRCRSLGSFNSLMSAPLTLCFITFILVLPKVLMIHSQKTVSLLDVNALLGYFQYGWFSQTSLVYQLFYYPHREIWVLKCFSNIALLIVVVIHLRNCNHKKIACVYKLYLSAMTFMILNEFLMLTPFAPISINFCLMRANYFSFLFLILLIPVMLDSCFKEKQYLQFAIWIIFVGNYALNPFGIWSVICFESVILVALLFVVFFPSAGKKVQLEDLCSRNAYFFGKPQFPLLVFVAVLICSGVNIVFSSLKSFNSTGLSEFAKAILFLNAENKENFTILYPFHESQEYFKYSEKPGFFNDYYIVLFSAAYAFDPNLQKKAFVKFKKLENEFGINTLEDLQRSPLHYNEPWSKAWRDLVDDRFVSRWRETDRIGYVIREIDYSRLEFPIVYQNSKYKIYKLN